MVHTLLVAALVLFVLWIVGLAGAWATHTAWLLFVVACVLFAIWAIASIGGPRRRAVP
jgi:hypothetical protein